MSLDYDVLPSFTGFCVPSPDARVDEATWVIAAMKPGDLRDLLGVDTTPEKIDGETQAAMLARSNAAVDILLTESSMGVHPVSDELEAADLSQAKEAANTSEDFRVVARAVNRLSRRNRILTALMGGLLAGSLTAGGVAVYTHIEEQRMSTSSLETFGPAIDDGAEFVEIVLGSAFAFVGALGGDAIGGRRKYRIAHQRAHDGVIAILRQ